MTDPARLRRPGTRRRRVVASPTGAPGDVEETPVPRRAGNGATAAAAAGTAGAGGGAGAGERDPVWDAEAERLRAERPPHWG